MPIKSILNATALKGKRVLWRVDFNVPMKSGEILDEYKIIQHLPSLRYMLEMDCSVIIVTHLGRPEPGIFDHNYSVEPLAKRLGELLNKKIKILKDIDSFEAGSVAANLESGDVAMLENIRFFKGEEENSHKIARSLSKLADVYVNDAFGVNHRAHASLDAIQDILPSYAGLLLTDEINNLSRGLDPQKPMIAIVGGVKLETKVPLLKVLQKKAEKVLIGGALANNFIAAHGFEVGKSITDQVSIEIAGKMKGSNLMLPIDVVVSTSKQGGHALVKDVRKIAKEDYIFDIGPETIKLYSSFIKNANTLLWNGPMGFFELKDFRHGTMAIARLVASRSKGKAYGIVGGGETVEALKLTKMFEDVDWVSTGGGAMLTYLGGEKMPGLQRLLK
jgi:3-phosphoglycerate kinase